MLSTDPLDILLTDEGDLDLSAGGPSFATGSAGVRQLIRIAILLTRGEWVFNRDAGFPWMENDVVDASVAILGQRYSELKVVAAVRDAIGSVPGVAAIEEVTVTFDRATRKLDIAWRVRLAFDDTPATDIDDSITVEI